MKANEKALTDEQMASLFGDPGKADHQVGDRVRFHDLVTRSMVESTIEYIQAPGPRFRGGPVRPTTYIMSDVDLSTGMPYMVYPSEIVEKVVD